MQLFDTTGTEYYRNVVWIIALSLISIFITTNYNKAVDREKLEQKYIETQGVVNDVEQWKRTRTRSGSSEIYYKFKYIYSVDGVQYNDDSQSKNMPGEQITLYYDPRKPSTHVLRRSTAEDELSILILGGIIILIFIGINVCLYKSKKKKICNFS